MEGTVEVFRGCFTNLGFEVGDNDFGALLEELFCDAFAETLTCDGGVGSELRRRFGIGYIPPPVTIATFPESLPDMLPLILSFEVLMKT